MTRKYISAQIAELDPAVDHQAIVFLLTCYVFPWDIERSLELALFRTYGVPAISQVLAQTGEFARRPRKRYDDTELIIAELIEYGYDSERGRRALRRMNQMHRGFTAANDDFLYVLSTFVFEPIRWIGRYGWRPLTTNERLAWFYFFREVGNRMNIHNIHADYDAFERFNRSYEQAMFGFAPQNQLIGQITTNLFLSMYLPKPLHRIARPLLYAALDEPVLDALGYPHPPRMLRQLIDAGLRGRGWLLQHFPERRSAQRGTERKRATYPHGYVLEDIGTFPNAPRAE